MIIYYYIFYYLVFQYFIAVLFDELMHLPVTSGFCKKSTMYLILDQITQILNLIIIINMLEILIMLKILM